MNKFVCRASIPGSAGATSWLPSHTTESLAKGLGRAESRRSLPRALPARETPRTTARAVLLPSPARNSTLRLQTNFRCKNKLGSKKLQRLKGQFFTEPLLAIRVTLGSTSPAATERDVSGQRDWLWKFVSGFPFVFYETHRELPPVLLPLGR